MRTWIITPALIVGMLAVPPVQTRADEDDDWKEARKRYEEREKDHREAAREWYKDRKEAEKDWDKRQREAAKRQREHWRDWEDHSARRFSYDRQHYHGGDGFERDHGHYGYQPRHNYGGYGDHGVTPYQPSYEGYYQYPRQEHVTPAPQDHGYRYDRREPYRYDGYAQDYGYGYAPRDRGFDRRESYYRGPYSPYAETPYAEEENWYPSRGTRIGSRIGSLIGGAIGGPEGAAIGGDVGADIGAEVDRR